MNNIVSLLRWKIYAFFSKKNSIFSNLIDWNIDKTTSIGKNVRAYHIKIGKYSYVARNTLIQNTMIGSFCSISEGCNIGMPSHPVFFVSTSPVFLDGNNALKMNFSNIEYVDCPTTYIGNDVWIGAHAQIKSGIKIGNGAIVGAGAVVTRDIPPYAIVGGIPARLIKYRFNELTCKKLNDSNWWKLTDKDLIKVSDHISNPDVFISKVASEKVKGINEI